MFPRAGAVNYGTETKAWYHFHNIPQQIGGSTRAGAPTDSGEATSIREQVVVIAHHIRARDDADQAAVFHHREAADVVLDHELNRLHRLWLGAMLSTSVDM